MAAPSGALRSTAMLFLLAFEGEEGGAHAVPVGRPLPALSSPRKSLDLDDLRPEEGQQHRAVGPGEDPGAVEHPDPRERGVGAGPVGAWRGNRSWMGLRIGRLEGRARCGGRMEATEARRKRLPRGAAKHTRRGRAAQSGSRGFSAPDHACSSARFRVLSGRADFLGIARASSPQLAGGGRDSSAPAGSPAIPGGRWSP